jgi:hypothetical protein
MSRTSWIAALALAASLLAGCDPKKSSPAPAADPKSGSPTQPQPPPAPPALPTPAPTPAQPEQPPAPPTPAQPESQPPAAPAQPAGPGMSAAEAVRKLTALADRVCSCADRACADAATAAAQKEDGQLAGLPSSADTAAMKAQSKRLFGCQQKLK